MTLIDVSVFNAAALPGGQIVIFDGALRETRNPDAMAGVLAHEIAHVRRRLSPWHRLYAGHFRCRLQGDADCVSRKA